MKKKTIKTPLFGTKINIIISGKMSRVVEKYNLNCDKNVDGACWYDNGDVFIGVTKKATAGLIAHEALHAVGYIFEDFNIKMDISNDEHQCYLLMFIVDKISNMIN